MCALALPAPILVRPVHLHLFFITLVGLTMSESPLPLSRKYSPARSM